MGRPAPVLLKGLSLLELASVIERARFFVGNDSGTSHMAAALGVPTVAIFGPTDPTIWSPRGKKVVVVWNGFECSPCSKERLSECQNTECLKKVEVEDVIAGIAGLGLEG